MILLIEFWALRQLQQSCSLASTLIRICPSRVLGCSLGILEFPLAYLCFQLKLQLLGHLCDKFQSCYIVCVAVALPSLAYIMMPAILSISYGALKERDLFSKMHILILKLTVCIVVSYGILAMVEIHLRGVT